MKKITVQQVLLIHQEMLDRFGGLTGIRDEKLLDSAMEAPFQTFDGADLFPATIEKIARMAYGIVKNHPFFDGNKRTGTALIPLLLKLNDIEAWFSDNELVQIGTELADGTMDTDKLTTVIKGKVHFTESCIKLFERVLRGNGH